MNLKNLRGHRYFLQAAVLFGLLLLFLVVQWMVVTFRNPSQMGVIESSTMEMTVTTPPGVVPVETETIETGPFASTVTYTGSAVAFNEAGIYPRVEGRIVAMPVYPGDRVRQGQLLIKLDTAELSARVDEARFQRQAQVDQHQAALRSQDRAREAIRAAKADLEFWQEAIQRSRALVAEEVITPEEAQEEESRFEAAQSRYQQALAELEAARFQAQAQASQAQSAAAGLQAQQIVRDYTSITAPYSGVITQRLISPGTLVQPEMQILELAQIHPIRIQAQVAESDLADIRVGSPVTVRDKTGGVVNAKVTSIFPRADLRTRTAIVEAVVSNPAERFIPGDFVTVDIQTGTRENAISVPIDALVNVNDQRAVWLAVDGKAALRFVTTGDRSNERIEVVEGLKPGERVIIRNIRNLQQGQEVANARFGPNGLQELPEAGASGRLSEENNFQARRNLEHMVVTANLATKPPGTGNNQFVITVTPLHGNLPGNLNLKAETFMPAMPAMATEQPRVRKTAPGRFEVTANFSMPGLWQLDLEVRQGNRNLGSLEFTVRAEE